MTTCAKYYQDDQQQDQILLEEQKQNIWKLLTAPSSQLKSFTLDAGDSLAKQEELLAEFVRHAKNTLAVPPQSPEKITSVVVYKALALVLRDALLSRFHATHKHFEDQGVKEVSYLSLEFLIGRSMQNAISNLELLSEYGQSMKRLGYKLEDIYEEESDAGLGNGGLGRLAACFMDSLATLNYPAWGYGLRYTYGIFTQKIVDGYQVETADSWLTGPTGYPWEVERKDIVYPVRFFGEVIQVGYKKYKWTGGEVVMAQAYDNLVPGYRTNNTLSIRLWSAKCAHEMDLAAFNAGEYGRAFENKVRTETITSVLYPNDHHYNGKELRLKQQFLFVSATLQDILNRFKRRHFGKQLELYNQMSLKQKIDHFRQFPDEVAIQLNDTHPCLGIPELMRLLVDDEGLEWKQAWKICKCTFGYTNHTVLPEALEEWPVWLMERLLPRHLQIIYDINFQFLEKIHARFGGDMNKISHLSIIREGPEKMVRMANLAIIGSHAINGVATIHSELVKTLVFPDFYDIWPNKFQNKTNGVTPRRWILQANPSLTRLITETINDDSWTLDIRPLEKLRAFAENPEFQLKWLEVKRNNKLRLQKHVYKVTGIEISLDAIYDVHIKRIHEYKRQLLNILYVIDRYRSIKRLEPEERRKVTPRVVMFAGKAAPGYFMAKLIIKLINNVANVVNNDQEIGDLLKVVFIPNYSVSQAEIIIPGTDLSQQISTAGTEASGTGNMKFAMNGALIIGTLDGANIEIRENIGDENMFIFGARAEEIDGLKAKLRDGSLKMDKRFAEVLRMIGLGIFGDAKTFEPLIFSLQDGRDRYLVSYDFQDYLRAQAEVDEAWKDRKRWLRMSIMSTAGAAPFSSDRTIQKYAKKIWDVQACRSTGPRS